MEIKLYNRNLNSPTMIADLSTIHERLNFSTKLHGGFGVCSVQISTNWAEQWEWVRKRIYYRLVITDATKTLFEGRIQDVEISEGTVYITAYGYYASCNDLVYNTAYNDTASNIIKAILTANCPQISSDQSHIEATDITITSAADASYLDKTLVQLMDRLLGFSDSTNSKWYFAIWEDRVPYLFKRATTSVVWSVDLQDFTRFRIQHRGGEIYNRVYSVYTSGGVLTRTAVANNTVSQDKYGDGSTSFIRSYANPQLGAVTLTAAEANRDAWLADYKDIWPRITDMQLGNYVYDSNGKRYPSSWVRAGDVLRIRDLVPASGDLDTVTRDALRTFYLVETKYDHQNGALTIVPDTMIAKLSAILARKV